MYLVVLVVTVAIVGFTLATGFGLLTVAGCYYIGLSRLLFTLLWQSPSTIAVWVARLYDLWEDDVMNVEASAVGASIIEDYPDMDLESKAVGSSIVADGLGPMLREESSTSGGKIRGPGCFTRLVQRIRVAETGRRVNSSQHQMGILWASK